jgi:hypothetical protein
MPEVALQNVLKKNQKLAITKPWTRPGAASGCHSLTSFAVSGIHYYSVRLIGTPRMGGRLSETQFAYWRPTWYTISSIHRQSAMTRNRLGTVPGSSTRLGVPIVPFFGKPGFIFEKRFGGD